jgi:cation-transporting ATPase E
MKSIQGLSEKEATARRKRGEGNDIRLQTSRTYHDIFRQNVFAFINMVLFVIGALLIAIGRIEDAVVSLVLIVANVVIGVYQEVRAKRQLDRIALLTRPQVTVIRDGRERAVDPAEVVLGDTLTVRQGDQIVVDGEIIAGKMEVDESLLSGESDLILKAVGDRVLSGSFCVTGKSAYEATRVGLESYANRLTADARIFRVVQTPLQREVDFIIRLLTVLALFIGMLLLVSAGLVPNGLFLMLIVAYAMGALRIVRCGALVQQSNSVESLSYVNMLCLDKTGTLTANRIRFHDAAPIGIEKGRLLRLLGDFAKNASDNNRTGEAIAAAMEGQ